MGKNNLFIKIILLLLVLNIFGCKSDKITKIELLYVSNSAHSSIPVNCQTFEYVYKRIYKTKIIQDMNFIDQFQSQFNSLKTSSPNGVEDVRIKCVVYYQVNPNDTLCIANNSLTLNNDFVVDKNMLLVPLIKSVLFE